MTGLAIEDEGGTLVLRGEFDVAQTTAFDAAVAERVHERGRVDLTLDLAHVPFIDSSAIRSVIQLARALAPKTLRLVHPQPMVRKVLELTSLADHPNIEVV